MSKNSARHHCQSGRYKTATSCRSFTLSLTGQVPIDSDVIAAAIGDTKKNITSEVETDKIYRTFILTVPVLQTIRTACGSFF